jgi:hypothetical protein
MPLTPQQQLALAFNPALLFAARGLTPDRWQEELLQSRAPRILLNCCRQAGKSTVVAALTLHTMLYQPGSLTLLVSKSLRQSSELFRKVLDFYREVKDLASALARTSLDQAADWQRFHIPASQVPRIPQEHLDRELRSSGPTWFNQEYECRFEAREGLVYPDLPGCVVDSLPPAIAQVSSELLARRLASGRLVGGIDFGFRDPTAAVWGVRDPETDILWLLGEFYANKQTLPQLVKALPRSVTWEADPSAALQIQELHRADFKIRPSNNSLDPGIQAVTNRIESGRLKILRSACPHLLTEAQLYQFDADTQEPIDKDNHALDALRYLIARLDHGFMARLRRTAADPPPPGRPWLSVHNERLWTPLNY